jgi:Raf kinase inhibitor-like YbhB/YbcL family protein
LKLNSDSFNDGDYLALPHILSSSYGFGCSGGNRSPNLRWTGVPAATKSFAMTCFDPDAPTGSGFWHWVVVNIPPETRELPENCGDPAAGLLPTGALQTRTDFGKPGYGGPCPPDGPHRYIFTVYAVSEEKLPVSLDSSAAIVGFNLHFKTLAKASIIGMARPNR